MTCWYRLGLTVKLCVAKFILSNNNKPKWADDRDTARVITEILTGWSHLAKTHFLIVLSVKYFWNVLLNKICVHTINLLRSFAVRISLLLFFFFKEMATLSIFSTCVADGIIAGCYYWRQKNGIFTFFSPLFLILAKVQMVSPQDCCFFLSHILMQFYSTWVF